MATLATPPTSILRWFRIVEAKVFCPNLDDVQHEATHLLGTEFLSNPKP